MPSLSSLGRSFSTRLQNKKQSFQQRYSPTTGPSKPSSTSAHVPAQHPVQPSTPHPVTGAAQHTTQVPVQPVHSAQAPAQLPHAASAKSATLAESTQHVPAIKPTPVVDVPKSPAATQAQPVHETPSIQSKAAVTASFAGKAPKPARSSGGPKRSEADSRALAKAIELATTGISNAIEFANAYNEAKEDAEKELDQDERDAAAWCAARQHGAAKLPAQQEIEGDKELWEVIVDYADEMQMAKNIFMGNGLAALGQKSLIQSHRERLLREDTGGRWANVKKKKELEIK